MNKPNPTRPGWGGNNNYVHGVRSESIRPTVDKDDLTPKERRRIERIKDRLTYGDDDDREDPFSE